jgi:hypothetical protein
MNYEIGIKIFVSASSYKELGENVDEIAKLLTTSKRIVIPKIDIREA